MNNIIVMTSEQQVAFAKAHDIAGMTAKEITQAVKDDLDDIEDPFESDSEPVEQDDGLKKLSKDKLLKLCRELTARVDELEHENKDLEKQNDEYARLIYDPFNECE